MYVGENVLKPEKILQDLSNLDPTDPTLVELWPLMIGRLATGYVSIMESPHYTQITAVIPDTVEPAPAEQRVVCVQAGRYAEGWTALSAGVFTNNYDVNCIGALQMNRGGLKDRSGWLVAHGRTFQSLIGLLQEGTLSVVKLAPGRMRNPEQREITGAHIAETLKLRPTNERMTEAFASPAALPAGYRLHGHVRTASRLLPDGPIL